MTRSNGLLLIIDLRNLKLHFFMCAVLELIKTGFLFFRPIQKSKQSLKRRVLKD